MEALLPPELLASTNRETRLICLRGRKYDPRRAASLLPNFLAVRRELFGDAPHVGSEGAVREQLEKDARSLKVRA